MRFTIIFLLLLPINALSQQDNQVNIYPNPATDEININIGEREDVATVKIISQSGKVVWSQFKEESKFKLNLEHYPEGVYYVQIGVLDKLEIYKFIKRNK